MKKNTINKLAGLISSIGMPFVKEALKDRETVEDWIKSYLNEELAKVNPLQFERAFENNESLTESLNPSVLNDVTSFIKDNDLDMREIHNDIKYHLPSFNTEWAMKWLLHDLPEFHERIILHPQRKKFELWLARQITDVGDVIINTFKSY